MSRSYLAFCYCALLFASSAGASGQMGLIGGPRKIDLEGNEMANDALKYAVHQHNVNLNGTDTAQRAVSEVLSAQSQVVQGMKYTFTVAMGKTNCTMDATNEVCVIPQDPENAQIYTCKFTVWSRPWMNSTIILNESCA